MQIISLQILVTKVTFFLKLTGISIKLKKKKDHKRTYSLHDSVFGFDNIY